MKKILIIEDDPFIRENVFEVLELSGYKAFTASNGKEGIMLAFEIIPDLIICDIMMPKMDGYEVKDKLSQNPRTKSTPFIFLTAKAEIKELRYGMALGADDYITKPFEIADLLQSIKLRFEKIESIKELFKIEEKDSSRPEGIFNNNILISSGNKTLLLSVDEIVFIKASGGNSEIFQTGDQKFVIRKNLKYWESHLPESVFLRVNQSYIINSNNIESFEKESGGSYSLKMKFCQIPISVGKSYTSRLNGLIQ